jgi:OFA family oxalate/formate antiporter-like MFS transporter
MTALQTSMHYSFTDTEIHRRLRRLRANAFCIIGVHLRTTFLSATGISQSISNLRYKRQRLTFGLLDPARPFDAGRFTERTGVFYGWVVLGFAVLGVLASVPGQTMGVSVFADPLIAATGLSRLALSSAYLVGTVSSGLVLPIGGRWLNNHGERATAIGACVLLALTLVALSQVDRIGAAIAAALSADRAIVTFIVVAVGFVSLRFSGQGLLTLSSRNLVGQWFDARRGLAAGIFGVLMSLGFSFAPVLLNTLIHATGSWRSAWLVLAVTVGVGMALIAWVFYRDTPEQCGLLPDGLVDGASTARATARPVATRTYTRSEALGTGPFWAVALVLGVHSATMTGITFNIIDLGASDGLSSAQALALFPPMAIIGVVVGLLAGMASDRIGLRWLVFTMAVAESVGYLGATQLGEPLFFVAAVMGLGTSTGLMSTLQTVSMPKLYGRRHLGATSSAQMSVLVIASALGPVSLALAHSLTGSYTPALTVAAIAPVAAIVLATISRDPRPHEGVW